MATDNASETLDALPTPAVDSSAAPSADTPAPTDAVSQVLADLGRAPQDEGAGEGDAPQGDQDGQGSPEGDELPDNATAKQIRDWHLRQSQKLAEERKALEAERSRIASLQEAPKAEDAGETPAQGTPEGTPAETRTAKEFVAQVRQKVLEAQESYDFGDGNKGYVAPGETILLDALETLAERLDAQQEYVGRIQQSEQQAQMAATQEAAAGAAKILKSEYGLELDPVAILGHVQSGAEAFAMLQGKKLTDLEVSPELFAAIVKTREFATIEKLLKDKPAPRLPDPNRGSGVAKGTEPLSRREQVIADLEEARSRGRAKR